MIRIGSRWFAPLVLGAVALGPVTFAVAADAPAAPTEAPPHGNWLQQRLGLSDDQAQQIRAIYAEQRQASRQIYRSLGQARSELRKLALNGADDATLTAKRAEVEQLLGQSLGLQVESLKKIAPILTPEQREKFAALRPGGGHHRRPRPAQQS
ncbi:MAG: periplasmic heavy metal sensor [Candidatus Rokubacteria bacterium]|nr:periplasmic heavy metal sensor [Candidatus Rokubacteria bacterium]